MSETVPGYNKVCAASHAAIGAFFITAFALLHLLWFRWHWYYGPILVLAYIIGKEYIYDPIKEHDGLGWTDPDGISASLQDATWYAIGASVALVLSSVLTYLFTHHL